MARYNVSKYNTFKYGVNPPVENSLSWAFLVDWDGDGIYDNINEANMLQKLKTTRGRDSLLRDDSSGFEPVPEGRLVVTVYDPSGDFDPYNLTSRLYPYVRPGAKFK